MISPRRCNSKRNRPKSFYKVSFMDLIFFLEQIEEKKLMGNLELCQKRILQRANDENHIGLHSLKKLGSDKSMFKISEVKDKEKLQMILCNYIEKNKKYFNKEIVRIKDYEEKAPFRIEQLNFVEKVLPNCLKVEKQLKLDEDNLKRNNMLLEKILLEKTLQIE